VESTKKSITGQCNWTDPQNVSTRNSLNLLCEHMAFVSLIEPKTVQEALSHSNWISVMQEELNQFTRNDV